MPADEQAEDPLHRLANAMDDYRSQLDRLLSRVITGDAREREAILSEAARITADLHRAFLDVQDRVYQLESEMLMRLVARPPTPGSKPAE